jgi:hypothetical protein
MPLPPTPAPKVDEDAKKKLEDLGSQFDKAVGTPPPAETPMEEPKGDEGMEPMPGEGMPAEGGEDKDLAIFAKGMRISPDTGKVLLAYIKTQPKFEGKAVKEIIAILTKNPDLMMRLLREAFGSDESKPTEEGHVIDIGPMALEDESAETHEK